jgi:tetratricopeptide (TPR) repeat protein
LADKHGANERERKHVAALAAWLNEDLTGATNAWEAILAEHPRDALALRLAHYMHFYLGPSEAMRSSIARVLDAWDESAPSYGFVLGMAAFAHEETGDYAAGERFGREAVERNPKDTWAVHAVAHVMEMQGRHAEGIDWLTGLEEHWTTAHNFRFHVWWHRALYHLERSETDAVLTLYDERIRGEEPDSDDYLDLTNGIALLWRLEALGIDVGGRWAELGEKSAGRAHDHLLVFADEHYIMALTATGRDDEAADMLGRMEALARTSKATEAEVTRLVGLPLARGIVAYQAGDYAGAADALAPVADEVWRIGGSNAQRDLFAQLLIHAELKAGRFESVRDRLAARTAARPASAASWRWLADANDGLGEAASAQDARAHAERTLAS